MYAINRDGGYITGVVAGVSAANSNATEAEYQQTRALLLSPPEAPEGHIYRLREDLEWELCAVEEPESSGEATEEDYVAALGELGVAL